MISTVVFCVLFMFFFIFPEQKRRCFTATDDRRVELFDCDINKDHNRHLKLGETLFCNEKVINLSLF